MRLLFLLVLFLTACAAPRSEAELMSWPDLLGRPLPAPTERLSYGAGETAVVDLWRPDGLGPHPVVLMIHGGCWQKEIADLTLMNYAAEDLRQRGLAVWNIEYRGVDEEGGGYPGTYLDVAEAADLLLTKGAGLGLDTSRIAGFGHSAGGHLVAWLALRDRLPQDSPLAAKDAFPMRGAVLSGALADLEAASPVTLESCLAAIEDDLTGRAERPGEDVYADTSPARLLPANRRLVSVNGALDRIAPPLLGRDFTSKAGPAATYREIEGAGHVELIAPGTPAFDAQAEELMRLLGLGAAAEEAGATARHR